MRNFIILFGLIFLFVPHAFAQTVRQSPTPIPPNSGEVDEKSAPVSPSSVLPLTQQPPTVRNEVTNLTNSKYVRKDTPVNIPRFETPPIIDGKLDDAVWKGAAVFGDFLQIDPGDNTAPTNQTEFMMGYDSKNLYLAFHCKEPKDKVRATVARRDNIFNDDYVLVHLDTFNDQRQAYLLFFNPLGIQADGTFTEGRGENYSLDIVMDSKGVLTDDGYTIEVAIPFKSLRYEAGKNKQWGLHINRRIKYLNGEYNSWMPDNRSDSGWLNKAGHITGLEGISTTRQLEINPSITISEAGNRIRTIPVATLIANPALIDRGHFVNEGIKGDLGVTAKFSLTPTITLDFAYNPDFAQVEADAPVVTANQRFPIFFTEKRPFFLERIDIFNTRMNIVNTRTIVDPDVAVKLTGRRGRNTFGLLYASDKYPGYTIFTDDQRNDPTLRRGIERFLGKNADIGVFRLKHDIGRFNNFGVFATTYSFVDRHNNVGGFDGRFRLDPKTIVEFQVTGTTTRGRFYDPNSDKSVYRTGNGFGYSYLFERAGRNLYIGIDGVGRTKDYRADIGFTPRYDTNQQHSSIQYTTERSPKANIVYKQINNNSTINFDWSGHVQSWTSETQGALFLQRQTNIGAGMSFGYEHVFEHEFGAVRTATRQGAFFGPDSERSAKNHDFYGFISSFPNKQIGITMTFDYNFGQLDFDGGAGPDYPRVSPAALKFGQSAPYDPGAGNQYTLDSTFSYQPTTAFRTSLKYTKTKLVRNDTKLTAFSDNIFSSRSLYQFSRNTFARLRLDYSTLNTHFRPQLVVGWTPNPGTAIYVGYNDDISYNGYNPFTGQFEPGLSGNGRTFFIKAAYLFKRSF